MPIRKPRRQTLQELSYPPVPAIGGKDLRADERTLGLTDWEIGDNSTRYPQSLLSSSFDGSRWGGSSVGGSALGWPSISANDGSNPSLAVPSSVGAPSSIGSPTKSNSTFGTSPTRSEATHHVKRKKPPTLDPEPSTVSSNPSSVSYMSKTSAVSSSVSKTSAGSNPADGVVRPGDIVPPDWSAAALSVVGSVPDLTPVPAPSSTSSSSSYVPPTSYKAPPNRKTSQPPPRRAPPSSHSHSHSQPLISVPTLPPIAASPRSTVIDVSPMAASAIEQAASVPPLRPARKLSTPPEVSSTQPPKTTPTKPPQIGSSLTLQAALQQETTSLASSSPARLAQTASPAVSPRTKQSSASKPTGAQLLQVPPPAPYGFTSQPAPDPAPPAPAPASSVSGSQVSTRSPRSPRALPVPPVQSAVSTASPPTAQPSGASIPRGTTAINTWRTGVLSSGPRGWGMPASAQPPPQPHFPPIPAPVFPPHGGYQPAPLPTRIEYQRPPAHARPPPARSYSYETPTGGFPLPTQAATNLDGYMSSPDAGEAGGGSLSPVLGDPRPNALMDDGRPGLQRAPSKLRRKLTKNRGWHPGASDPAAPTLSAPAPAPAPPRALEPETRPQRAPRSLRPAALMPSDGQGLVPAQRAFIGTHRSVQERILWGLPLDRDPRVRHAISKIEGMRDAIVTFGAEQFIETQMRGAVICNVDYRREGYPGDLAFDWITYRDAQKTLEPTLQKAIARTDPAAAVLVVVFLPLHLSIRLQYGAKRSPSRPDS